MTNARCKRNLRVRPHHHRRRERVRFRPDHVARNGVIADNDGRLDARDVGLVVRVGEAADVAAGRAGFADRVAGRGGGGVGDSAVEGEDVVAGERGGVSKGRVERKWRKEEDGRPKGKKQARTNQSSRPTPS